MLEITQEIIIAVTNRHKFIITHSSLCMSAPHTHVFLIENIALCVDYKILRFSLRLE